MVKNMKETDTISVIVPIYNAESTVERCIYSIINQSYKKLEIILINDGSKDSSKEICKNIIDDRIVWIDQMNNGVSHTRNTGIKHATGKYICFIDSDDYIEVDHIKNMYECMIRNSSDLVISNFYQINEKGIIKNKNMKNQESCNIMDCLYEIYTNSMLNPPWNKLYKRKKIINLFDENLSLGEDLIFNVDYIKNIQKISVINSYTYYYDIFNGNLHRKKQTISEFLDLYQYIYKHIIRPSNINLYKFDFFVLKHYIRFLHEQHYKVDYKNYVILKSFCRQHNIFLFIPIFYLLNFMYILTRRSVDESIC